MQQKKILIADDEPVILDLLKRALQDEGYQVFLASNGQEAFEIAKNISIDAAILDIRMPQMDGIKALKEIKALAPNVEVLIMTAYADLESLKKTLMEHGAFDYLVKPFKGCDVIPIIKNALRKNKTILQENFFEQELEDKITRLEKDFKERTRELRESQIKYKEIIENSNDMILVVQDGNIQYANRKTLELTGYSEDEILGLPFLELINPEDRALVEEKNLLHMCANSSSTTYSFRALRENGESFLAEVNAVRSVWEGDSAVLNFIRDISERIKAEQHIRTLSQKLMKAQETERQKLSRELHDRLAQDLSTLKIGLDTLLRDADAPREIKKKVPELSKMLQGSIMAVRDLAYDLRPPSLGLLGISRTVNDYCEDFAEKNGVTVDFYSAGLDDLTLDSDIEINLYRLIQEALNNIKKHAEASYITVKLVASFPHIILRIEDKGKGFSVKDQLSKALDDKRMGLISMEERVALLQGKMKILSRLNQGTKVFIEVPYTDKTSRSPVVNVKSGRSGIPKNNSTHYKQDKTNGSPKKHIHH